MTKHGAFAVHGRVITRESGQGVFGLEVLLYDKDHLFDDLLGSTWTDTEGKFFIEYREESFRDRVLGLAGGDAEQILVGRGHVALDVIGAHERSGGEGAFRQLGGLVKTTFRF